MSPPSLHWLGYRLVVLRPLHCCLILHALFSSFFTCFPSPLSILSLYFFVETKIFPSIFILYKELCGLIGHASFHLVGPMGLLKPFPSCFPFVPAELAYWAFCYIPSSLGPFKAYSYSLKRAILLWLTLPHCLSPVISQCVLVLILYVHSLFFGPCLGHAYLLSRPLGCSPIALLSLLLNLFFLAWFGLFCH